jgi:hypothetical protein
MYNQGAWALTDIGPNDPGIRVDSFPFAIVSRLTEGAAVRLFRPVTELAASFLRAGRRGFPACQTCFHSSCSLTASLFGRRKPTLSHRCGEPPCPDR